jgi:hypothetical protein
VQWFSTATVSRTSCACGTSRSPSREKNEVLIRAGVNPADSKARASRSARAQAFDIKTSIFHSSPAWMPPVSWSGRARMSPNSNKEIA